jgi:hypothetical protein
MNIDAAMVKMGLGGAVVVVCRTEAGVFVGASTLTVDAITNPTIMEAMSCREAMTLA